MKLVKVKNVKALSDVVLFVEFDNGFSGSFNISEHFDFNTPIEKELLDPAVFKKVFLNKEFGHIEWPNGFDISPEYLYSIMLEKSKKHIG